MDENTTPIQSPESNRHELKILPELFDPVNTNQKRFEVRRNDRAFKVGDVLYLREWHPAKADISKRLNDARMFTADYYTGRNCFRRITYILEGGQYGILPDFVILSLGPI